MDQPANAPTEAVKDPQQQALDGLDLTAPRTYDDLSNPFVEASAAEEATAQKVEAAEAASKVTGTELVGDIIDGSLSAYLYRYATDKTFDPDPNFTKEQFEERFKAATEKLPEEYWGAFDGVQSAAEFDHRLYETQTRLKAAGQLAEAGWGWHAANFLAGLIDPTALATGMATGYLGNLGAAAAGVTSKAALGAAAGAAGGAGIEGAYDALGRPTTAEQYAWAIGAGAALGGLFGSMARNPATQSEAAQIAAAGRNTIARLYLKAQDAAEKVNPFGKKGEPTQVSMKRAHETPAADEVVTANGVTEVPPSSPRELPQVEVPSTPEPAEVSAKALAENPHIDPESLLERVISAHEMKVSELRSALAEVKGKPEEPSVRAEAVAANKELQSLKQQLKALQERAPSTLAEAVQNAADTLSEAFNPRPVNTPAETAAPVRAPAGRAIEDPTGTAAELRAIEATTPRPQGIREDFDPYGVSIIAKAHPKKGDIEALRQELQGFSLEELRAMSTAQDGLRAAYTATTPEAVVEALISAAQRRWANRRAAAREGGADAGAAFNDVVTHDFLQDNLWKSIPENAAPSKFANWRMDWSGKIGRAKNAAARLVGSALLNDTVGKADHSLNAFSADLDLARIVQHYQGSYNRFREPAFREWADALNLGPVERLQRGAEFYEQVGLAIRDSGLAAEAAFHPAIFRLANAVRDIQRDILADLKNPLRREGLEGRPIQGAAELEQNPEYLWRLWHHEKLRGAISEEAFGQSGVTQLIKGAIMSAQSDIDEGVAEVIARGFVQNLMNRGAGLTDKWSSAIGRGAYDELQRILTEDLGGQLTPEQIADVVTRLRPGQRSPEGNTTNLRRRVLLDEKFSMELPLGHDGETARLAVTDLLENNVNTLLSSYIRRQAGRITLGRVRVRLPEYATYTTKLVQNEDGTTSAIRVPGENRGGELLLNGITSDGEWRNVLDMVGRYGADHGQAPDEVASTIADLQFVYERLTGIPDPRQLTPLAQWLRRIGKWNTTRLMNQVGISQLGETATPAATLGLRAMLQHIPAFKRIVTDAGESQLDDAFFADLEAIGIGVERLHGLHWHNLDEVADGLPFQVAETTRTQRLDDVLNLGTKATYEFSGNAIIQQQQERATAAAVAQKFANMAMKLQEGGSLSRGDTRRLAQLGISEPMMKRIMAQITDPKVVDFTEGPLFGKKLARLNFDRWTDLEARAALENSIFRYTRKLVQVSDTGSYATFMSEPLLQALFQFRNFTFTAWQNQFLYNVHMFDTASFNNFAWSLGWNAMVRAAQLQLLAAGRSDRQQYLEKNLSVEELAKAGFQRAGWTSILPMVTDTALTFTGNKPIFQARSSGQPADVWLGSPYISTYNQAQKGTGGAISSLTSGKTMSQSEVRALAGLLPFSNHIVFSELLSTLIQDRPLNSASERYH